MNKEQLTESIENVKTGINSASENIETATYHKEEGELILAALKAELDKK